LRPRLFIAFHDPWDALGLATALPGVGAATFGGDRERAAFEAIGVDPVLVDPGGELQTLKLLDDVRVAEAIAAEPSLLVSFKPSARLEARAAALGATMALAPARIAQGLENKLALAGLAEEASVDCPGQVSMTPSTCSWAELGGQLGDDVVVQPPRGFAGRKTWRVRSQERWREIVQELGRRKARVARYVAGRPGTLNAVVDSGGRVVASAPIVQVTGDERLTPYRLGSCGNDFVWRPAPHPGEAALDLARRLGPVLAARGYRGHFGVDFVFDGTTCWLIEVNARLTASLALMASWDSTLLREHLAALRGEPIEPRQLPPIVGGQLIRLNTTDGPLPAPVGQGLWPSPKSAIGPGERLVRATTRGVVVNEEGALDPDLLGRILES
jgi:glutathione synthase/RimK-type ligase-like ATP-grasp enzyme